MNIVESSIDIGPVTLAYTMGGENKKGTLVFSHSLFFDKSMFRHQMSYFSSDYRVVAYDHRGQGGSSVAADGRYDVDVMAEDAVRLIEMLDFGPVHFAGNSLGGFVALRLAARRPDLVRSVIALGSTGDAEEDPDQFAPLLAHLGARGGEGVDEAVMRIMFGATSMARDDFQEERQKWRAHISALKPLIVKPATGVVRRGGINRELAGSPTPILAIAGAEDQVYPERLSQAIAKSAPRGGWTKIERAGHSVALEQAEAVNAAIVAFIARLDVPTL